MKAIEAKKQQAARIEQKYRLAAPDKGRSREPRLRTISKEPGEEDDALRRAAMRVPGTKKGMQKTRASGVTKASTEATSNASTSAC